MKPRALGDVNRPADVLDPIRVRQPEGGGVQPGWKNPCRLLADDARVRIWNLHTGQETASFTGAIRPDRSTCLQPGRLPPGRLGRRPCGTGLAGRGSHLGGSPRPRRDRLRSGVQSRRLAHRHRRRRRDSQALECRRASSAAGTCRPRRERRGRCVQSRRPLDRLCGIRRDTQNLGPGDGAGNGDHEGPPRHASSISRSIPEEIDWFPPASMTEPCESGTPIRVTRCWSCAGTDARDQGEIQP